MTDWAGKTPTAAEWRDILEKHAKYWRGEAGGERANLTRAYLYGAELTRAYLYGAELTGANLSGANLTRAELTGANLTRAELDRLIALRRICPETGSFTAWKRLRDDLIAQLEIPAKAKRIGGLIGRKCRAESAKVIAIWKGKKKVREGFSTHDGAFRYVVGKVVKPAKPYSDDARIECASGIHFFMSRLEAEEYK